MLRKTILNILNYSASFGRILAAVSIGVEPAREISYAIYQNISESKEIKSNNPSSTTLITQLTSTRELSKGVDAILTSTRIIILSYCVNTLINLVTDEQYSAKDLLKFNGKDAIGILGIGIVIFFMSNRKDKEHLSTEINRDLVNVNSESEEKLENTSFFVRYDLWNSEDPWNQAIESVYDDEEDNNDDEITENDEEINDNNLQISLPSFHIS